MTSPSLLLIVGGAVLLFWAVGAYNRLVRLRAEANQAFAALDAELTRQARLVESCAPAVLAPLDARDPTAEAEPEPEPAPLPELIPAPAFWAGLQGASAQLLASLAAARHRPLAPGRIAALAAARDVLAAAWERAERDDAHDLSGPRLPDSLGAARAQMLAQAALAAGQFEQAVGRYNAAIGQFPAVLLAWLFGFRQARGL